jgi:hypothetical protein
MKLQSDTFSTISLKLKEWILRIPVEHETEVRIIVWLERKLKWLCVRACGKAVLLAKQLVKQFDGYTHSDSIASTVIQAVRCFGHSYTPRIAYERDRRHFLPFTVLSPKLNADVVNLVRGAGVVDLKKTNELYR